jgi:hypothetical protein
MGPKIVVPEAAKGTERAPIGHFLPPKKRAGEAYGYFPNSF